MKVLIVGSGGREHALAWKLAQEADVIVAPGNPGTPIRFDVQAADSDGLGELARREGVDLIVIGPEDPLIAGAADELRAAGFAVFGPGKDGARLEGSKAFSKNLMRIAKIPTAEFETFTDTSFAKRFIDGHSDRQWVVKASGAALGKGVLVTSTREEAHDAIDSMPEFGDAGKTFVIEERLFGPEFSLLTLCNEEGILSLPVAQDHKRALDGDRGPNTGGMGTYSPVSTITEELVRTTEQRVVLPALEALTRGGVSYRGVLFSGLMVHEGEPRCLEFNVRFGDPETQSVVLRLGKGFAAALLACAKGEPIPPVEVIDNAAVSVVLASGGYPGSYEKGKPITIGALPDGVQLFHAGTARRDGHLVTNGGRVLSVSASAPSIEEARRLAYEGVEAVDFQGKHYRRDIASR